MIRVFTTHPQAATKIERDGPPSYEELCAWVGVKPGYLEVVTIQCGDDSEWCQLWIDEEGKFRPTPTLNRFATVLYHGHFAKQRIVPNDVIVGNAVLLSGPNKME